MSGGVGGSQFLRASRPADRPHFHSEIFFQPGYDFQLLLAAMSLLRVNLSSKSDTWRELSDCTPALQGFDFLPACYAGRISESGVKPAS